MTTPSETAGAAVSGEFTPPTLPAHPPQRQRDPWSFWTAVVAAGLGLTGVAGPSVGLHGESVNEAQCRQISSETAEVVINRRLETHSRVPHRDAVSRTEVAVQLSAIKDAVTETKESVKIIQRDVSDLRAHPNLKP